MDPSFFGLSDHPFSGTEGGDERGVLAEAHASLITELRAGLKAPHGITLLIGDSGAGKTAFARTLAERLSDTATVAFLPTTGPGLRHLLSEAIEQLGGDTAPAADEDALLETLKSIAKARAEHYRPTVIVVDDAQELPAKTLERLSKLFGSDPAEPSMLHVILVGRQELLDRMNAANDRSILKHLIQVCRMDPIGPEDSFRYIAERVSQVGGVAHELFSEEALKRIVTIARGVPCKIDMICSASLEEAAARGDKEVGEEIVKSASMNIETTTESSGENEESAFTLGEVPDEGEAEDPRVATGSIARIKSLYESRRKLLLWGGIFVAAMAGFAAALTGTPGDETSAGGPGAGQQTQVAAADDRQDPDVKAPAAGDAKKARKAAKTDTPALLTELNAVPKLVVSKDGTAASKSAGTSTTKTEPASTIKTAKATPAKPSSEAAPSVQAKPSPTPAPAPRAVAPPTRPAQKPAATNTSSGTVQSAPAKPETAAKPVVTSKPAAAPAPARATAKTSSTKPDTMAKAPASLTKPAPVRKAPTQTAKAASAPTAIGKLSHGFPGRYTVQIGAYGVRANAEAALAKVNARYGDARIIVAESNGKRVYRVVSGAFDSKSAASRRQASLKGSGFTAFVRVMK